MKQKLLNSFRLKAMMLVAVLCALFTGQAWADTSTLTFTSACGGSGTSNDGLAWTITSDGTESTYDSTSGIHYGTNNASVKYITLTTTNLSTILSGKKITKIIVNARDAQSNATITVSVGSTTFTANSSNPAIANTSANFRFDGEATIESTNQVTVDVRRSSSMKKAIYVKSIEITYEDASAPSYTITAQSNNNNYGTVSLSSSVITATPATGYTYASPAYTVSPANSATVTQNGNVFTVTPSANTTVTINFEAIPTHTATFSVNGNTSRTATVAEGAAITFPEAVETTPGVGEFPKIINGKIFVGWHTSKYSDASVAPTYVNTATATMGDANVIYYAVYADVAEEESEDVEDAVKSQTLQYDTWTYSGSTTDKSANNYRLFGNGSYIESEAFDLSKLIKVVVYGGTFGGSTYNSISIGDGTSTWKDVTVSGSSQTGENIYTGGTALSGTKALRITSNSGDGSNNGIRISKVDIYVKGTTRTESNYTTDIRSEAGISFAEAEVSVQRTSGYAGQALTNPNSVTVAYSSSDETVATVNGSTGAITELLKAGTTTITATFAGDATYQPAAVSYALTVTEKIPCGLAYDVAEVEKLTTDGTFTNALTNGYSLTVAYSSSDTDVATVHASTGEVTIKGAGSITITASFAGDEDYEAGNASYTLTVSKATPTLSFASENATGREGEAFAGNELNNPAGLSVCYSSSDTDVATVNETSGAVTIVAGGTTTITASFAGNDTYTEGSVSYTLKVLATPTIPAMSDEEIAWGSTFVVDDNMIEGGAITVTSSNEAIATVSGLTITPAACGEVVITVSTAEDETYKAGSTTFTLTVTAPEGSAEAPDSEQVVFYESFNTNEGTGGNDGDWSGSIASDDFKADNSWTTTNAKGASACTKFGTSSNGGSATTPEIELEEDIVYTLTFKAGAWDGKSEATTLSVAATNATIKNEANTAVVSSVTTVKREWTSYTLKVIVTDESDPVTITFSTSGGNKRFFLDEVKVFYEEDPTATVGLNASGFLAYASQYPMDFSSVTGFTAWQATDVSGSTITFEKITGKIQGGQGVLLKGTANAEVTIPLADSENVLEDNLLKATLAPTYFADETIYGLKGDAFYLNNPCTLKANRAYFNAEDVTSGGSLSKSFTFIFEDPTTGITETRQATREEVESIFNLGGQRLQKLQRGINIVNGKKVLVK